MNVSLRGENGNRQTGISAQASEAIQEVMMIQAEAQGPCLTLTDRIRDSAGGMPAMETAARRP